MSEWISINEELPSEDQRVFVYDNYELENPNIEGVSVAVWQSGRWLDYTGGPKHEFEENITHWKIIDFEPPKD